MSVRASTTSRLRFIMDLWGMLNLPFWMRAVPTLFAYRERWIDWICCILRTLFVNSISLAGAVLNAVKNITRVCSLGLVTVGRKQVQSSRLAAGCFFLLLLVLKANHQQQEKYGPARTLQSSLVFLAKQNGPNR